jgi:hypothetical protein
MIEIEIERLQEWVRLLGADGSNTKQSVKSEIEAIIEREANKQIAKENIR